MTPGRAERAHACSTVVVHGADAVLAVLPRLIASACAWEQQEVIDSLAYFLSRPVSAPRTPCLIVIEDGVSSQMVGAVLLARCDGLLRPFRFYLSADRRGRHVVFGPAARRVEFGAIAAQALLLHGAGFVDVVIDAGDPASAVPWSARELARHRALAGLRVLGPRTGFAEWTLHGGMRRFELPLAATFEATLGTLGKTTRRNLRRYERRCAQELGAVYVEEAELEEAEWMALNQRCTHPVAADMAHWRYRTRRDFADTFRAGLRDGSGVWLALVGGRRRRGVVEIDWQMNRRGYETYSLGTALRSALLAHEVERGSTSLRTEGGTSHRMAASFRPRRIVDLAVRRPSLRLRVLAWVLRRYLPDKAPAMALPKPWRVWQPCLRSAAAGDFSRR